MRQLLRQGTDPFPLPGMHVVQVVPAAGGWQAECIPHGHLGWDRTHLGAFVLAYTHDWDTGGGIEGRSEERKQEP